MPSAPAFAARSALRRLAGWLLVAFCLGQLGGWVHGIAHLREAATFGPATATPDVPVAPAGNTGDGDETPCVVCLGLAASAGGLLAAAFVWFAGGGPSSFTFLTRPAPHGRRFAAFAARAPPPRS